MVALHQQINITKLVRYIGVAIFATFLAIVVALGIRSQMVNAAPSPTGSTTIYPMGYNNEAQSITRGPDGNMWFTDPRQSKIGRITPGGTITKYSTDPSYQGPRTITAGSDGNLWFTQSDGGSAAIGRITPGGTITDFPSPTTTAILGPIQLGSDGNLWFTQTTFGGPSEIGRITPSGTITEFPLASVGGRAVTLAPGPDGAMWFVTDTSTSGNRVLGRITPSGTITEFPLPGTGGASSGYDIAQDYALTTGPDGNLWYADRGYSRVLKITTGGVVTQYSIAGNSQLTAVVAGPDGAMWVGQQDESVIHRVGVDGVVSEFTLPNATNNGASSSLVGPSSLAVGPDGNLWFSRGVIGSDVAYSEIGFVQFTGGAITPPVDPGTPLDPGAPQAPNAGGAKTLDLMAIGTSLSLIGAVAIVYAAVRHKIRR